MGDGQADQPTMTALRARVRGGPEVLAVDTVPVPEPGPGQVLVAVRAAGITYTELEWDETWTRDGQDRTPVIPSHEFSGVVAALGAGVTDLLVGEEVFGMVRFDRDGAAAEFVVAEATDVALKPAAVDHRQAATLPLSALTAWQALVEHGQLPSGGAVLVLGGAGAVGSFAVQIAAALGAQVTATCLQADVGTVSALGAGRVVAADDPAGLSGAGQFDVVLDTVGGAALEAAWALVRPGGHLVTLRAPLSQERADELGIHADFFIVQPDRRGLTVIADLVDSGRIHGLLAATFPLTAGREAYLSGTDPDRPAGKTVLEVAGPPRMT
jgi:NADPH:quinone reductase-like Zn-dependent oxidoreductase